MPKKRRAGRPAADFSADNQILLGAAEAFGERGYAETSVEDICQAADVSRRTFYRFYRSKDDVFSILHDHAATALTMAVRSAVEQATNPVAKLEAAVDAYLRVQAAAGPLARVLFLEPLNPNSRFAARREAAIASFMELFHEASRKLNRKGADPLVYRGLLAALENVSIELLGEGKMDEAAIARGRAVMLRILAGSLGG
jgi:AcrR family transcriptional regulator